MKVSEQKMYVILVTVSDLNVTVTMTECNMVEMNDEVMRMIENAADGDVMTCDMTMTE